MLNFSQYSKIITFVVIIALLPTVLFSQNFFFEKIIKTNYDLTMTACTGDINGDSLVDIVGGALNNDTIFWWENNGDLNFTEHIVNIFENTRVVEINDINNDGYNDIIAIQFANWSTISWFENDGNENFTEHIVSDSFELGHTIHTVDLDDDGDIDILASSWGGSVSFSWFENDGNGNFSEHIIDSSYTTCPCIYAEDINGDSILDIVACAYHEHSVLWFENDGSESFTKHIVTASFGHWHWVYAADFNNDDNMDISAVSSNYGLIGWFENDGNENFYLRPLSYSFTGAVSVFAKDINNDGNIDILGAADDINLVAWWENNGNGQFTQHIISDTCGGVTHVMADDIDSDGWVDVLCSARLQKAIILFENRDITELTDLHLYRFSKSGPGGSYHILPGETGTIEIELICDSLYSSANNIGVKASTASGTIVFTNDSCSLGTANPGDTVNNSGDLLSFTVNSSITTEWVDVVLEIYSSPQSLTDSFEIKFLVGDIPQICVVNADDDGEYIDQYITPVENLGFICDIYDRWDKGPIDSLILDYENIIWYTGDASSNVLTTDDIVDLSDFLDAGGDLFITGQNIAEDLQGNSFLSNYLHSSWVNNSTLSVHEGVSGGIFDGISIATTGEVPNQTSRDILNPENNGFGAIKYYNTTDIAGITYFQGNYKLVFFGFGFEAINETGPFVSQDSVLSRILNWFEVGVEEEPNIENQWNNIISLSVTSFLTESTDIKAIIPRNHTGNIYVYDMTGRNVRTLAENLSSGNYNFSWNRTDGNGDKLKMGSYILKLDCGNVSESRRVFIIR